MDYRNLKKGQASGVIILVFAAIVGLVGLIYVALPIMNTGIVQGSNYNFTNSSGPGFGACLGTCNGANFTGYPGGIGVAQATYIITVLGLLAVAGMYVAGLIGGRF